MSDEFVRCVRKCEEECGLREGAPCVLPCDVCDTTKTMVSKDMLYWLRRLEDAIEELETVYENRDWDEVYDLIEELKRIHKNIEEFVMTHGCF
jgi:hypothetical protein